MLGLVINFIHHFWPSLIKLNGFLKEFVTPIIKATKKGQGRKEVISFFTIPEYTEWALRITNQKTYHIKYYKVSFVFLFYLILNRVWEQAHQQRRKTIFPICKFTRFNSNTKMRKMRRPLKWLSARSVLTIERVGLQHFK